MDQTGTHARESSRAHDIDSGPRPVQRSHWWREVLVVAGFYILYSIVRDVRGDKPVSILRATTNAHRIIDLERHLGVFHEATIQHWFLHDTGFIRFWDDYYGSIHFIAVVVVLVILFFRFPSHYRLWRNTLVITNLIALVGYSFFPLLPPRLLPPQYHFVDTLEKVGGLWNFSSGPVDSVSNQYAAMPSLHTAWAVWCALSLVPIIRPVWGKVLVFLYPLATLFCIVVTANHYFADEVAGLLVLLVSYLLARVLTIRIDQWWCRRHDRAAAGRPAEPEAVDGAGASLRGARTPRSRRVQPLGAGPEWVGLGWAGSVRRSAAATPRGSL